MGVHGLKHDKVLGLVSMAWPSAWVSVEMVFLSFSSSSDKLCRMGSRHRRGGKASGSCW